MQKSMHGQMGEMVRERLAVGDGLARGGLVGDDDVAEYDGGALPPVRRCGRKRQHVGRLVVAAPDRG